MKKQQAGVLTGPQLLSFNEELFIFSEGITESGRPLKKNSNLMKTEGFSSQRHTYLERDRKSWFFLIEHLCLVFCENCLVFCL